MGGTGSNDANSGGTSASGAMDDEEDAGETTVRESTIGRSKNFSKHSQTSHNVSYATLAGCLQRRRLMRLNTVTNWDAQIDSIAIGEGYGVTAGLADDGVGDAGEGVGDRG